jgi:hypothetical protein
LASGFLPTPPHGDAVAFSSRFPSPGLAGDLHPQHQCHAWHTMGASRPPNGTQGILDKGTQPFLSRAGECDYPWSASRFRRLRVSEVRGRDRCKTARQNLSHPFETVRSICPATKSCVAGAHRARSLSAPIADRCGWRPLSPPCCAVKALRPISVYSLNYARYLASAVSRESALLASCARHGLTRNTVPTRSTN